MEANPAPGEPKHGASLPSVGCASADRHPAGGAAVQPPAPRLSEAVRAPGGDATPLAQGPENNAFFNWLFLNKLPRELRILLSEADTGDKQALGADLFTAHKSKQAHDVVAAVAAVSIQEQEGEEPTGRWCAPEPAAASEEVEADSEAVGGQEEARTRWQGMAGVPHCLSRGAGQVGDRAVLQPLLLRGQR